MGGISGCADIGEVGVRAVASEVPAAACHRRSRSASDKKLEFARADVTNCAPNVPRESLGISHDKNIRVTQDQDNPEGATPSHRVSLENDIEQLQMRLHQEKSIRTMLEQALGRASSTLSPGHKHFNSKTRELISEIQLLEEEVASREQHVLTLYRSIFDQCVSEPPSSQCSGTPSPSRTKPGAKKHPHIISSAFCSSRKFSLQSFQVLSSIRDPGKKDAQQHYKKVHQLNGKTNCSRSSPMKVSKMLSSSGKGNLSCSSKNNSLHQCPSKLSEELVRWMASIYRWACEGGSEDQGKAQPPMTSRSSMNTILPRQGVVDNHDACTRTIVEVSCISMNKNPFSTTTIAIRNYRSLIEQLERVNISKLENKAKLAFWVNVHNSLVMHAYLTYGIPYSSLGRMSLFRKAAYNIGGQVISASTIEDLILCCQTPRTNRWLETILWTTIRKKSEEKQILNSEFSLLVTQPLVSFALCTGASSDPPLRVYTAKHIEEELEMAKKDFLQGGVVVKKLKKITSCRSLYRNASTQTPRKRHVRSLNGYLTILDSIMCSTLA